MKYIKTIVPGVLTLFFGTYAMVLELNEIKNSDQVGIALLFGFFIFMSTW